MITLDFVLRVHSCGVQGLEGPATHSRPVLQPLYYLSGINSFSHFSFCGLLKVCFVSIGNIVEEKHESPLRFEVSPS